MSDNIADNEKAKADDNDAKVVTGGTMWTPRTYADANAAYQTTFLAVLEESKKKTREKNYRQGGYSLLISLVILVFVNLAKINIALSSDSSTYYAIANTDKTILTAVGLIGSLLLGWGLGTFALGFSKYKLRYFPIVLTIVLAISLTISMTTTKIVKDNFTYWLESTASLSSFVEDTPQLADLSDKKVAMLNTDGEKVTVTFSTKNDKVRVLNVEPDAN
jgi:uncharacterized protein YxeA